MRLFLRFPLGPERGLRLRPTEQLRATDAPFRRPPPKTDGSCRPGPGLSPGPGPAPMRRRRSDAGPCRSSACIRPGNHGRAHMCGRDDPTVEVSASTRPRPRVGVRWDARRAPRVPGGPGPAGPARGSRPAARARGEGGGSGGGRAPSRGPRPGPAGHRAVARARRSAHAPPPVPRHPGTRDLRACPPGRLACDRGHAGWAPPSRPHRLAATRTGRTDHAGPHRHRPFEEHPS